MSNAVKFTERGSVELSVRFAPLSGSSGAFTFSVRDTGIGISPEESARIFEPFYQADDSNTRKYGGTGLGLSISQRLLQKMGSVLKVESVPGEGSRFFFTLRLEYGGKTGEARSDARAETYPPESGAHISPGRMKENPVVLIVEDEKMSMKMLALLVSKLVPSASVIQAENGEQAVALFRERRPDLVFMDLQMSVKDGFEATAEIRAIEAEADSEEERCCIVALTADVLPETRGECLARGMDDYISKPVSRAALVQALNRWLAKVPREESPIRAALQDAPRLKEDDRAVVVWNRDALTDMLGGDEEMACGIVSEFLEYIPGRVAELRSASAEEDIESLRRLAHTIKGFAGNVGAESLHAMAFALEDAARRGDLSAATVYAASLEQEFEHLKQAMLNRQG